MSHDWLRALADAQANTSSPPTLSISAHPTENAIRETASETSHSAPTPYARRNLTC